MADMALQARGIRFSYVDQATRDALLAIERPGAIPAGGWPPAQRRA